MSSSLQQPPVEQRARSWPRAPHPASELSGFALVASSGHWWLLGTSESWVCGQETEIAPSLLLGKSHSALHTPTGGSAKRTCARAPPSSRQLSVLRAWEKMSSPRDGEG